MVCCCAWVVFSMRGGGCVQHSVGRYPPAVVCVHIILCGKVGFIWLLARHWWVMWACSLRRHCAQAHALQLNGDGCAACSHCRLLREVKGAVVPAILPLRCNRQRPLAKFRPLLAKGHLL